MNFLGTLRHHEAMSAHTSWRVGGPARQYYEPNDREDLLLFIKSLPKTEPILWLGLGSNTLVRDGGFQGTVICLHGAIDTLTLEPSLVAGQSPMVHADAGVHCARLAKFAQKHQLAGLGFMAGIPGTVGGALAMNAGAWGGDTFGALDSAEVLFRSGRTQWLPAHSFAAGYRHINLPDDFCGFLAARFAVTADTDGSHEQYTKTALAQRKATQPVGKPSAGSTFRNPVNDHAARLIEAAGLKGHRIGGAHVSTQHANFVITEDGASAADVETLIGFIQHTVQQKFGVLLQPEVRMVGDTL